MNRVLKACRKGNLLVDQARLSRLSVNTRQCFHGGEEFEGGEIRGGERGESGRQNKEVDISFQQPGICKLETVTLK